MVGPWGEAGPRAGRGGRSATKARIPLGFALSAALALACSRSGEPAALAANGKGIAPADSQPTSALRRKASFATPARVVPRSLWSSAEPRLIVSGLRAERAVDGSIRVARDLLPGSDDASALPLPERFGGGVLFFTAGATTQLFRAESWTAPLVPLASVEMRAERVEPGFDRLYLIGRRETRALDATTGMPTTLGALPPAAGYRDIAFGSGFGALVDVPLGGVLATFDAGQNWWPVPGARGVVPSPGELLVTQADESVLALDEDGTLRPVAPDEGEDVLAEPERAAARDVLANAVLHGAFLGDGADGTKRALLLQGGVLFTIDLETGLVIERHARVTREDAVCQALSFEGEPGFVCTSATSAGAVDSRARVTEVGRVKDGRWKRLWRAPEARAVVGAGGAGALIEGPCSGAAVGGKGRTMRAMCVVSNAGAREIAVPTASVPVSTEKGIAVVVPPRKRDGTLALPGGASTALVLPKDEELRRLLTTGQWLNGAWQAEDGRLGLWVAGGDTFVGVRIDEKGRVEAGAIQRPTRRALISERFALLWGAAGFARETTDGGLTWSDAAFPYRTGDSDPTQPNDAAPIELGCSAVGCALGPWLRIGWGSAGTRLVEAEVPQLRAPVDDGGARWRLSCRPTGSVSEPALPEESAKEPWVGLWETPPPSRAPRSASYTLSTLADDARIYAWGPDEGSWGERGNVQIVFRDAASFEVPNRTAIGRTPWPDAQRAALAFAEGGTSGIAVASAAIDPGGKSGLLLLRSPAQTQLFVFEAGRPPLAVQGAAEAGFAALDDVVQSGDAWYTTHLVGTDLRVYRVRGGRMEVAASLPVGRGGAPRVRLVRSARGGQLALWVVAESGSVVYPLDLEGGGLGSPVVVPALASRPPACAPEANGYVISEELTVAPLVDLNDLAGDVDVSRVTAELLVGAQRPCVERLSATTRDAVRSAPSSAKSEPNAAPLTLTEKRAGGRRWEFLCYAR